MRCFTLALIAALCLASLDASVASAQAAEPGLLLKLEAQDERRDVSRGYDGGYVGTLIGAYLTAPLLGAGIGVLTHPGVGLAAYLLTAPAVHVAYGNPVAAVLALFGPTTAALSSAFAVAALQPDCHGLKLNCWDAPVIAGIIGYATWAVVDILVHAREDRPRLRPRAPSIVTRVSYRR